MKYHLETIRSNQCGFEALSKINRETYGLSGDNLDLDFSLCTFF